MEQNLGYDLATEEGQLMFALQKSAMESTKQAENVLDFEISNRSRSLMTRDDKHQYFSVADGIISQFNTLNQFGDQFDDIKEECSTASSICGWLTIANAILLRKFLIQRREMPLHMTDVRSFITQTLCNVDIVLPELRKCILFTQSKRHDFWNVNGKSCADKRDLMQWVANYEMSELLTNYCGYDKSESLYCLPSIFMRYNQWPERYSATKDEFIHLQSESRFGGVINSDDGSIKYANADSIYFIEEYSEEHESFRFTPEERLLKETSARAVDDVIPTRLPRVVIINLNGHFVSGLACEIESVNYLFIFNTTEGSYIDFDPMIMWSFDTCFTHKNTREELT